MLTQRNPGTLEFALGISSASTTSAPKNSRTSRLEMKGFYPCRGDIGFRTRALLCAPLGCFIALIFHMFALCFGVAATACVMVTRWHFAPLERVLV